jgi:hypothetical protein
LGIVHTLVMYLGYRVADTPPGMPIVIDGYYFKMLAKCRLFNLVDEDIFALWRCLPQPSSAIYLHAEPATTWMRAGERSLSPIEYYSHAPCRENFERFQRDLEMAMLHELGPIPVTRISGESQPEQVLAHIETALLHGVDHGR